MGEFSRNFVRKSSSYEKKQSIKYYFSKLDPGICFRFSTLDSDSVYNSDNGYNGINRREKPR